MAVEDSNTKRCTKCGDVKPASEFHKDARRRDGLQCGCKSCHNAACAKYRAENIDKVRAKNAKWQATWQAANPDKHAAAMAKWRAANPEKVTAWHTANPDKVKAGKAAWRAANPEAIRIHNRNRRARKRESVGKLSNGLAQRLFKLQRGKCACGCKKPLGDDYHLDHRMPLALGGANEDWNIQLLRKTCNLQKQAKHPIDFMRQRGFLL